MLEPIKFLFILTGASTYLVTKYIKVGIDDNIRNNSTNISRLLPNESWNESNRSANAIARLGHNTSQFFSYESGPSSSGNSPNRTYRGHDRGLVTAYNGHTSNRYRNDNQASTSNSYHIALITSLQNQTHKGSSLPAFLNNTGFRPTFEVEINEEDDRQLPKRLLQISLSNDDNSEANERVLYHINGDGISADNPSTNKFSINSTTGEIYALRALDRDGPLGKQHYKLNAYAQSVKNGQILGYADIVVYLRDINDNIPTFSQSVYHANISENGTANMEVIRVVAHDLDDGNDTANSNVVYAIKRNQIDEHGQLVFDIDSHTGLIRTLVCCLDRERRHNYTIEVTATDGGGLQSSALVVVNLVDVNDEQPHFAKKEWFIDVHETDTERPFNMTSQTATPTHQATVLLKLSVEDNDLWENNHFSYKIVDEQHLDHFERMQASAFTVTESELTTNLTDNFVITTNSDGSASLRIVRPLDYEIPNQRFIILKVLVSDKRDDFSDRFHTDVCFVYIKVRDTNDNKPRFAQSFINVSLPENVILGTIITKFSATDADQNGHSQVMYSLDNETNKRRYFSIDSEGLVRLSRPLDRESIPTHMVKVIASDTDEPALISTATLVVNVEDINDNPPFLINTSLPPVLENSPPTKLGELFAFDQDDPSKGNGPPFTFYLDPASSEDIKKKFRLEVDYKGEGKAILYSKVTFDREQLKQYSVPIVVRDSGYPSLSATCSVTVMVGDLNDNDMKDGWKDVTVYYVNNGADQHKTHPNAKSLLKLVEIGQVNVEDPDDWDLGDKTFSWNDDIVHPNFFLDTNNGAVFIKNLVKGNYNLKFNVFDRKYKHKSFSSMRVQIKNLSWNAVINSGSLRIEDLDSFQFVSIWDWKTRLKVTSLKEKLEQTLQQLIGCDLVEIFSIIDHQSKGKKMVDIRYFATSNKRFLSAVYLNGVVQQKRDQLTKELELNISQVGINECMSEQSHPCESTSCFTDVVIDWTNPSYLVRANFTSFVGIRLITKAKCTCFYDNLLTYFDHKFICDIDQTLCASYQEMPDSCIMKDKISSFTRNYITSVTNLNFKCVNRRALSSNSRSFKGDGWLWLDPLPVCTKNVISLQMATSEPSGIIFYSGPLHKHSVEDFMLLELVEGKIRLLFDFGSGISEITIFSATKLHDGNWHQVDIYFDTFTVVLMLDTCAQSAQSRFEGVEMKLSSCQNSTRILSLSQYLNVNSPFQVGGISPGTHLKTFNRDSRYAHSHLHARGESVPGFTGCIRNLVFNGHIYDLTEVHHSHNSQLGCYPANSLCSFLNKKCHNNGLCDGNYNRVKCICNSGYYGADCSQTSSPIMFKQRSFIHLSMIRDRHFNRNNDNDHQYGLDFYHYGSEFDNGFITKIDFNFRTRQTHGEIVRLMGQKQNTFCIVEIRNAKITFRYNLNPIGTKWEKILSIESFVVNDGKWHHVEAFRFGQSALLTLDGGGIGKSNRLLVQQTDQTSTTHWLFDLDEHQIVLGGQVHYLGMGATTVTNDFADGCLADLKINDIFLSLPDLIRVTKEQAHSVSRPVLQSLASHGDSNPAMPTDPKKSAVQISITKLQNVNEGCKPSYNPCASLHCPKPYICVDEWMLAKCRCPSGYLESDDAKGCTRSGQLCKSNPCLCRQASDEYSQQHQQQSHQRGQYGHNSSNDGMHDSAKLSRFSSSGDNSNSHHISSRLQPDCDQELENEPREATTTVNARIFQIEYGVFVIVIVALVPLNIPFIAYIVYICCRKKQSGSSTEPKTDRLCTTNPHQSTAVPTKCNNSNDDVRENVVCYRDEGGGEHDIRAYDMIPLRIQVANGIVNADNTTDQFGHFLIDQLNFTDKPSEPDAWQELTVI